MTAFWKVDWLVRVVCATSRTTAIRRAGELKTWLLQLIQTCRRATTEELSELNHPVFPDSWFSAARPYKFNALPFVQPRPESRIAFPRGHGHTRQSSPVTSAAK